MQFSHYSGCGNDFIIRDDRDLSFPLNEPALIQSFCKQAGVDGLILVRNGTKADFRMLFFNNDGTEASMCGNGMRCFFQFIREKLHFPEKHAFVEIQQRTLGVKDIEGKISVAMGPVEELGWNILLGFQGELFLFHHLNTGVPHIVTFINDIEAIDVESIGAYFRNHPHFGTSGTNVNFVDAATLQIRTFERGVEGETLACGTGCTAAAYALHTMHGHKSPITLQVRSKEHLTIDIEENNCSMTGPALWIKDLQLHALAAPIAL